MEQNQPAQQAYDNKSVSSTEFSTNSKGFITYSIKVYNENPEEAFNKAQYLMDKAEKIVKAKNEGRNEK